MQTGTTQAPVFIYRQVEKPSRAAKELSLHRRRDWQTGLSFLDFPHGRSYITFRVERLEAAGFVVQPDGGKPMTILFTHEPYIEPNSGVQWNFPEGHVTVYHPNKAYWDTWHEADLENLNSSEISAQLAYFVSLREVEERG